MVAKVNYKLVLILILSIFMSGCNDSEEGSSGPFFSPSLPESLIRTTYESEITFGGDISGDDPGNIEVFNELTGEKTYAGYFSQEKCASYLWLLVVVIPFNFCLTDTTFAATIALEIGSNPITVIATDSAGTEVARKSYLIERKSPALSNLVIDGAELTSDFQPSITEYGASVCSNVSQVRITPELNDYRLDWASSVGPVSSDGHIDFHLNEGINEIIIRTFVHPQLIKSSSTETIYRISIDRGPSTDATLEDIKLSTGILASIFDPLTYSHTAHFDFVDTPIKIAPIPADPCASATVNGITVPPGEFSEPLPLGEGPNLIVIGVDDQVTTNKYSLMAIRDSSSEYLQSKYLKGSGRGYKPVA